MGPSQAGAWTNTGPFSNFQSSFYWSGTEYASDTSGAWYFYTGHGYQSAYDKNLNFYALALRLGEVAAAPVPEPVTLALFGMGLAGLGAAALILWSFE